MLYLLCDFRKHSEIVSERLEDWFFLDERDNFVDNLECALDMARFPQQGDDLLPTRGVLSIGMLEECWGINPTVRLFLSHL